MHVLNIILSHQREREVSETLRRWEPISRNHTLLLAYGGSEESFRTITYNPKVLISDRRLRTRDHQRERQSYTSIVKAAAAWLDANTVAADFVHLAEYDHVPLVEDLNERQIALLESEGADLLGYNLLRIDGTNHPHYLHHIADPKFENWLSRMTERVDPTTVLSMLGTGSFWTRPAFDAVAACDEPFPIYVELYLPTLVHHLGFRVRSYGEQDVFVSHAGERSREIAAARAQGAWSLHPVKRVGSNGEGS